MSVQTRRWLLDALERTLASGVEAALVFLVAAPKLDMTTLKAAALSGGIAAAAFAKAALARFVHRPDSASLADI